MVQPSDDTTPIIGSSRRVAIAADSCALLTSEFVNTHNIPVAKMRINIGEDSFTDNFDLDYSEIYRSLAGEPETRAWVSAPLPEEWLETIRKASQHAESVICIAVAAGLSASYDSALVAAETARNEMKNIDIRVVDSATISGALKMLVMDATRATDVGLDADGIIDQIRRAQSDLRTIAALDTLNRMHHIANTPRTAIRLASALNIKPVVTFDTDEFRLIAKPISMRIAIRRMLRNIAQDLGDAPARFVVLHVDAPDRAGSIARQILSMCDCQLMDISDFHPFIGLYAGQGAIGIAWQKLPPEQLNESWSVDT